MRSAGRIAGVVTLVAAVAMAATPLVSLAAEPGEVKVEEKFQAALFAKIFAYVRSLPPKKALKVAVLDDGTQEAREVARLFVESGIASVMVQPASAAVDLPSVSVVYTNQPSAAIDRLCRKYHILSVTGTPALVKKGEAAVGLVAKPSGKPEILIHRSRVAAEGHDISSALLNLATLFE